MFGLVEGRPEMLSDSLSCPPELSHSGEQTTGSGQQQRV